MTAIAYETYLLGVRTTRRFIRVPANVLSILFFPIIMLLVFSQLYEDIIQLPGFGGDVSYLAYLAPGQIVFTAFFAMAWAGFGLLMELRTGYTDKLRASPIHRWSILASEMVPLFFQAAAMSAIILVLCVLLGTPIATGIPGALLILVIAGLFGLAISGTSFIPALVTKSEQATSTLSLILFPVVFASTAFVPEELMPEWMQVVNQFNPVTYVIEAVRALMVTGYDWNAIGTALLSILILGVILQIGTIWAFNRVAR
jgi:ABC-2 type transport system permease protein